MFPTIAFCSTLRIGPYLFYIEQLLLNSKQQKKMLGHRSRFRENDDLPLWQGPAVKKEPPYHFLMRALQSRVKLCARGMHNAILGNDLKEARKGFIT